MISKTKIEEAARQPKYFGHLVSEANFIRGAEWAIEEIEKTASVGFDDWWETQGWSFIMDDEMRTHGRDCAKEAWIACSLAKDTTRRCYSCGEMAARSEGLRLLDKIQSLEAQLKERDERIERLLKENHQMIRNEKDYCNQIKERDEALGLALKELTKLRKDNKLLVEALEFYADARNYSVGYYDSITSDCEDTARQALKEIREGYPCLQLTRY